MIAQNDFALYLFPILCLLVIMILLIPVAKPYFRWRTDHILGKVRKRQNKNTIMQSGGIVTFHRLMGWCLSGFGVYIFILAPFIGVGWFLHGTFTVLQSIGVCIVNFFFGSGIVLMGMYFVGLYPDIEFNADGAKVNSGFIRYTIKWQEITSFVSVKKEIDAIVLTRRGMLLNRLYGSLVVGLGDKPVILIRKNARHFNNWKEFISEHISMKS